MNTINDINKSSSLFLIIKKVKINLIKFWQICLNLIMSSSKKVVILCQKRKRLFLVVVALLFIIAIIASLSLKSLNNTSQAQEIVKTQSISMHQKNQAGDYLTERLQDISDQLITIHHQLDQSNNDEVKQQIASLIDQIKMLSSESNKLVTQQIQDSTQLLQKQLILINARLIKLQAAQKHIKYLKTKDLPFRVISIDNIQQNNVVTIVYNRTTFPIEEGSYVAGWKLISADFVTQKTEFVNSKSQHVIVDLNRLNSK